MAFKHWRRRVSYPLLGIGTHVLQFVVGCLPYSALPALARFFAPLISLCHRESRRLVAANLAVAFPEWDDARRQAIARESRVHALLTGLEFLWFGRNPARLAAALDVSGPEVDLIRGEGDAGNGVLLVSPHVGNWELMGQALVLCGLPVHAVAARLRNPWLDRLVSRSRKRHGMKIIYERGAAREIIRVLKGGEHLAVLMDQNTRPSKGGIFVDYFWLPAATTRAPAALARKLQCKIVVGACVREDGKLCARFSELPRAVTDYESDEALTHDLLTVNRRLIEQYPEQYAWLYRLWRYVPPGSTPEEAARYPYYSRFLEE